jgi:hypothetical protein
MQRLTLRGALSSTTLMHSIGGSAQLRATLGSDGEPLVDGLPWHWTNVARHVEAAGAPGPLVADRARGWYAAPGIEGRPLT